MCFLDKKKQLPGDEFDISVWKPLDTKGKPINQDEPLIYNHYSGKAYSFRPIRRGIPGGIMDVDIR